MNSKSKSNPLLGILLTSLLMIFVASCSKDNVSIQPITLAFENGEVVNNSDDFELSESAFTLKLYIKGGDEKYMVSNNNDDIVTIQHQGDMITISPLAIGKSTITIKDNSDNSYSLSVLVKPSSFGISSYRCLIYGDGLTDKDKTNLETEMLSLIKGYKLFYNDATRETGVLRLFLDKIDGERYDEYDFTLSGEIPESCKPIKFQVQIISWLTLKSEKEETILFITDYIPHTENIPGTRGNSLVIDVTSRYKTKYPDIEKAYIVQIPMIK